MTSNSEKMTLEEKLVQQIKTTTLAGLIDDEDAIASLVKKAIHEALFQSRIIYTGKYGESKKIDSPVVEAARDVVKQATSKIIEELIVDLLQKDEFKTIVRDMFADMLPLVMKEYITGYVREFQELTFTNNIIRFKDCIKNV